MGNFFFSLGRGPTSNCADGESSAVNKGPHRPPDEANDLGERMEEEAEARGFAEEERRNPLARGKLTGKTRLSHRPGRCLVCLEKKDKILLSAPEVHRPNSGKAPGT